MDQTGLGAKLTVTVVTASYNSLAGLRETVASVAAQVDVDVEHVIVDGGSNDGTRDYLESLGNSLRWISEPDEGISDAMNKGIALARGEYILVLQAEDRFLSPQSLSGIIPYLQRGADIVSCEVKLLNSDGTSRIRATRPFGYCTELRMTNPHQGMFCKRALFDRIGMFDSGFRIAMDYDFLLRAKHQGASLLAVPRIISVMPETGVSTLRDWFSVRRRLLEDRRLQAKHRTTLLAKAAHHVFWTFYWPYKWLNTCLTANRNA